MDTYSLQNFCLEAISKNFSIFCRAYQHVGKGSIVSMHLEILQKRYCDKIREKLLDHHALRTDHLYFLINKYTRQLDLRQIVQACDLSDIIKLLQEFGKNIHTVSLSEMRNFRFFHKILVHLHGVECLDLRETICPDASLFVIAENCPNLKSLDLQGCARVTDAGLLAISESNIALQRLNIEKTAVTYKGVANLLKTQPSLVELCYECVPRAIIEAVGFNERVSDLTKECYKGKFNLSNLVVHNNPLRPENHLTSILRACPLYCPLVDDLVITEIVTDEQLQLCSRFENLKKVSLVGSSVVNPRLCINEFLQVRAENITSLTLVCFCMSVNTLASSCTNLESLSLDYVTFLDCTPTGVHFPKLKSFDIKSAGFNNEVDVNSVSFIISSSPNLQRIGILHSNCTEQIQDVLLTKCPKKVNQLNLSSTLLTFEFAQEILQQHRQLSKFIVENSGLSSDDYDDLLLMVDEMGIGVEIIWADFSQAIRELFSLEINYGCFQRHQLLKL